MRVRSNTLYLTVLTLSSTSAVLAAVQPWGQCGGTNYQGDTTCTEGHQCVEQNAYYSQCLQSTSSAEPNPAPSSAAPVGTATTLVTRIAAPSATNSASAAASSGTHGESCALNAAFVAKGKKYIGTAADQGTLSDATNAQIVVGDFGQVTPENS